MRHSPVKEKTFHWEGINAEGKIISGLFKAKDKTALIKALQQQEILFKKIIIKPRLKKVKTSDIASFSRQLATMLSSGIPLIQSFDMIAKEQKKNSLEGVILALKEEVSSGLSLKESLEKHPKHFNSLFCTLVDAGEQSGSLDLMLQKIADYQEKLVKLKKKTINAFIYPTAIMSLSFIITAVLLVVVVPQFETLFRDFGARLPTLTRAIISLSKLFQQHVALLCVTIGGSGSAFFYAKQHSLSFKTLVDNALLQIPIFGALLSKTCIARFSRTLAITYAAGIAPIAALEVAANASNHPKYANAARQVKTQVASGLAIHTAMNNIEVFPQFLTQMIAIGEASGTLEQMLNKVALLYEEEVDNTIDSLSSLLEPVLMTVLGILVGGLCLAMYLPIFQLGTLI